MIAFGAAIASDEKFERYALKGIELAMGEGARLIVRRDQSCIFAAYNSIMEEAAADPRIEGLVLIHEDAEIRDPHFEDKLRWAFTDPDVAVVGTIGAVGVQGIDWWSHEYGVGSSILAPIDPEILFETPLIEGSEMSGAGGFGEVDTVDGYLLGISRWAIKELRFDTEEVGPGFHGYDADICFQARERGRKVFVIETAVAHHRNSVSPTPYREDWLRAQIAFRSKWERRGMLRPPRLRFPPYIQRDPAEAAPGGRPRG